MSIEVLCFLKGNSVVGVVACIHVVVFGLNVSIVACADKDLKLLLSMVSVFLFGMRFVSNNEQLKITL